MRYKHLRYEAIVGHFFQVHFLFSVIYLFQLPCGDHVLDNIIHIIHSVYDCTTGGIIPCGSFFNFHHLVVIHKLSCLHQTVYWCAVEDYVIDQNTILLI